MLMSELTAVKRFEAGQSAAMVSFTKIWGKLTTYWNEKKQHENVCQQFLTVMNDFDLLVNFKSHIYL